MENPHEDPTVSAGFRTCPASQASCRACLSVLALGLVISGQLAAWIMAAMAAMAAMDPGKKKAHGFMKWWSGASQRSLGLCLGWLGIWAHVCCAFSLSNSFHLFL